VRVEDLVRRAQGGDIAALDALIGELSPYLGRVCGAIAVEARDDALQETLIAIVRNVRSLRQPAAVHAWARRIAVREAIRTARKNGTTSLDPTLLADVPSVDEAATAVEVHQILESLLPEQRAVLVLRHFEGLTEREIAEALCVPPGTVKSRLHRARVAFRRRWTA
jgi:RNA polymerase sigma-70 factor (ECF subfamily)